jgi:hypothetical protein
MHLVSPTSPPQPAVSSHLVKTNFPAAGVVDFGEPVRPKRSHQLRSAPFPYVEFLEEERGESSSNLLAFAVGRQYDSPTFREG